jgi:hypothetical protein
VYRESRRVPANTPIGRYRVPSTKLASPEVVRQLNYEDRPGVYGLFLIGKAVISPNRADPDLRWARFGLPIPLSVDNVAAGTALGLAGFSPWLAPVLFGCMTFVMSVAGHQIRRTVAHFIDFIPKMNTDLLTGACFALMAILMAFGVSLPLSYG